MTLEAEQVTDPVTFHGEGPVWSPRWGGLRWVDMFAGDILSLTDGEVERRHVGTIAAVVRPRRTGGAVIAVERGFAFEETDGSITVLDRSGLEAATCQCYGTVQRQFEHLLGHPAENGRHFSARLVR